VFDVKSQAPFFVALSMYVIARKEAISQDNQPRFARRIATLPLTMTFKKAANPKSK